MTDKKKPTKKRKPSKKKIRITKVAYEYRLANKIGDVITVDPDFAKKLIEKEYGVEV